jgi:hypothetical protein
MHGTNMETDWSVGPVTYELADHNGTTELTVRQDINATQEGPTAWPRTTGDQCSKVSRK